MINTNIDSLLISEVKLITPESFHDFRGYTSIAFDTSIANELDFHVIQINQGYSLKQYTLRGFHYQDSPNEQAKLVSCLQGSIYNIAVDIRKESATFGQYVVGILSAENQRLMYIPKGFAHGYLTLEPNTLMQWCVDGDFCGEKARCLRYDSCGVEWPVEDWSQVVLSEKDKAGIRIETL